MLRTSLDRPRCGFLNRGAVFPAAPRFFRSAPRFFRSKRGKRGRNRNNGGRNPPVLQRSPDALGVRCKAYEPYQAYLLPDRIRIILGAVLQHIDVIYRTAHAHDKSRGHHRLASVEQGAKIRLVHLPSLGPQYPHGISIFVLSGEGSLKTHVLTPVALALA